MINGAQEVGFLRLERQISLPAIRYLLSIMVTFKDEMKKHFQGWYATEVQKQMQNNVAVSDLKVEMPTSLLKNASANWIISTWSSLQQRPQIAINGFRKSGILSAVTSAIE
uniref:DDE-1 domain-containing protein n=1 Tax=Amphimedon queenslandica TaxID=400682 RepID=A0A1X7TZ08_AMPQE